jgi:hypothetical protein
LEKHTGIASYFNSDVGVDLQFLDSCLTEEILLRLAEKGIAAIPVHDSFICKARHRNDNRKITLSDNVKFPHPWFKKIQLPEPVFSST